MKYLYSVVLVFFSRFRILFCTYFFKLKYLPYIDFHNTSRVMPRVKIDFHGDRKTTFKLKLGKRTKIFNDVFFQGSGIIEIGENTYVGAFSILGLYESIIIGKNVIIGHGAVITKGLTLGNGSIIGANAVVTKNVAPFSIVGGVPAKLIKMRKKDD